MSLSKLGVFANLALAASAVLIPSTITADQLGDDNAMEGMVIDTHRLSVALECPDCPFATKEDNTISWRENAGNAFQLDFEIDPQEHTFGIAGGSQLFPPNLNDPVPSIYVSQIDPKSSEPLRLRVTGYEFRFNGAETVSSDGMELLPMHLRISSIEGAAVEPPTLTINVLKDANGRLMIASFDELETAKPAPQDNCNAWPLLCQWKSMVSERIEAMKKKMGKPCHKRPHGHHNPMAEEGVAGKPPHRFRPGTPHPHHRPHHMGHQGHGHHHRMHRFASRALFTILIPIVIGIFAGTVTYLVGMVLGTLIAMVIAKIRGQRYQRISLDEEDFEEAEVETASKKEEYAELPAYDAPPVYADAVEKEVDESK